MQYNAIRESALWRGVVVLVAAALFPGCTSPGRLAPDPSAEQFRSQLVEEVTANGALVHIQALLRIAGANGGNRATPSPGYDASVDYVAGVLREAGLHVSTPSFVLLLDDGGEATVRNVVAQTRTENPQQVVMAGRTWTRFL
jgi:aminopeptidase S